MFSRLMSIKGIEPAVNFLSLKLCQHAPQKGISPLFQTCPLWGLPNFFFHSTYLPVCLSMYLSVCLFIYYSEN